MREGHEIPVVKRRGIPEPIDLNKKWRGWDLRVGHEVPVVKRRGIPEPIDLNKKWRGWDLNPEPMAYESTAPPLSYLASNARLYYLMCLILSTHFSV